MKWGKFFGVRPKTFPVWVALCTGRADGSNPKCLANVKHPILAMVRGPEPEVGNAICSLLQSNGWREPAIQELKLLDEPFHSDDPIMSACHEGATKGEGGVVVYSEPIEES
jgi:hypothetical protein